MIITKKMTKRLFSAFVALMMMVALLPASAFAANEDYGITTNTNASVDSNGYLTGPVEITLTIGEDVTADELTFEVFEDVSGQENGSPLMEPGDTVTYNVTVVDNSGKDYKYVANSAKVYTQDLDSSNEKEVIFRAYNVALGALFGYSSPTRTERANAVLDENIAPLLREKYSSIDSSLTDAEVVAQYLDDWYLDYYNNTYKSADDAKATTLTETSDAYQTALFNGKQSSSDSDVIGNYHETNAEVIKLGWHYLYNYLFSVDDTPVLQYDSDESAQEALESKVTTLASGTTTTFTTTLDGSGTGNAYQEHAIYLGLTFKMVLPSGSEEEKKDSKPGVDKQVKDGENSDWSTSGSVAAGGTVEYKLTSNVPETLGDYIAPDAVEDPEVETASFTDEKNTGTYKLAFHDVIDSNLTIDGESVTVTVGNGTLYVADYEDGVGSLYAYVDGVETVVGTYELNRTCETDTTDSLYVELDLIAIYNAVDKDGNAYFTKSEFGTASIVVTYSATAASDLKAGKYDNSVWVEYEGGTTEKPVVPVYSYGIKVFKYDQSTETTGEDGNTTYTGLAGATFELKDAGGNVVATLTSGEDGYISVEGLKAGTYTLTETEAPKGYVKSDTDLTITLPDNAKTDYIAVANFANSPIPHTGGSGTMMYTVGGIAILCLAGVAFVVSRRKENA